jgi:hypothetical protein
VLTRPERLDEAPPCRIGQDLEDVVNGKILLQRHMSCQQYMREKWLSCMPLLCAAGLVLFGVAIFRSGSNLRRSGVALAASVFIEFGAIIAVNRIPAWEYLLPVADSINLLVFAWFGYATLTAADQLDAPRRLEYSSA